MPSALLVRFHPSGPWRLGPASGERNRVETLLHSDTLYSAVTEALALLGERDRWLEATARAATPAVALSSAFPFQESTLYAVPPRTVWPPDGVPGWPAAVPWSAARLVPLNVIRPLLAGQVLEEGRWMVDAASECLVSTARYGKRGGPFRIAERVTAPVDRVTRKSGGVATTACLEFREGCGLWAVAVFRDDAARDEWQALLTGACKLLGDSGIGGERSRGWGGAARVDFRSGALEELLLPTRTNEPAPATGRRHWLLSVVSPADGEPIDWAASRVDVLTRNGRIGSTGQTSRSVRLLAEGSVVAAERITGTARDVAPEGYPHPVYRAGFAVTLPLPEEQP